MAGVRGSFLGDIRALDRFKQRLKITFTKALITLALNEFEKDWSHHGSGKHLQQYFGCATVHHTFAINQYSMRPHPI